MDYDVFMILFQQYFKSNVDILRYVYARGVCVYNYLRSCG